jgi:hypothetical protein
MESWPAVASAEVSTDLGRMVELGSLYLSPALPLLSRPSLSLVGIAAARTSLRKTA